ncbi:MAG: hypothetical protein JKY92_02210 [Magnetovibrio sp.]|nr:hypothetical protein [Magnetovibrio sp.]
MPIDVRKLIFSKTELLVAFESFCRDKDFVDSQAGVESFEMATVRNSNSEKDALKITVSFASPDPRHPIQTQLNEDQILEVLVTTCKAHSIPLPLKGAKFVKQHKDGVVMSMGLTEAALRSAHTV